MLRKHGANVHVSQSLSCICTCSETKRPKFCSLSECEERLKSNKQWNNKYFSWNATLALNLSEKRRRYFPPETRTFLLKQKPNKDYDEYIATLYGETRGSARHIGGTTLLCIFFCPSFFLYIIAQPWHSKKARTRRASSRARTSMPRSRSFLRNDLRKPL